GLFEGLKKSHRVLHTPLNRLSVSVSVRVVFWRHLITLCSGSHNEADDRDASDTVLKKTKSAGETAAVSSKRRLAFRQTA
ncbi:hypothetical protein DNTS_001626, partial [Danionella cerebrum]